MHHVDSAAHASCRNYGVESKALEVGVQHPELLASRAEVIEYYRAVLDDWMAKHQVEFVANATFDFGANAYTSSNGVQTEVDVQTKVVDARFMENDLPMHVAPKFAYSPELDLIPPNELPLRGEAAKMRKYCVLGAGKTVRLIPLLNFSNANDT